MTNFNESIDTKIFMTLQISKKCLEMGLNRPPLYLSGPGLGKSTAVELFAEVNGYDLVLLRISNETPDTITGYDTLSTNQNEIASSAKHIRPSWFQKILDNKEKGIKSVLFLDELTTADTYVQGAALNLVFDRRCHAEKLPDDTLICAAGNYANNLSNEMQVLAPMLNRFMIVNIIPEEKDLSHFLCKYEGGITGNKIDFESEIKKAMKDLKDQEKVLTEKQINSIGEQFQEAIKSEAKMLIRENILKLEISELKDIYSDQSGDNPVPNFFSFRSMNYLLDAAVACYICFGQDGIKSDNFKNIIHGTVGLALSRDNQGNVKKTIVTDRYYDTLCDAVTDIEKMFNDKLPEYQEYFTNILNNCKDDLISVADMNVTKAKLTEMLNDKDISTIERPLNDTIIEKLCGILKNTVNKNISYKFDTTSFSNLAEIFKNSQEDIMNRFNTWNELSGLFAKISEMVRTPDKKYSGGTRLLVDELSKTCRGCLNSLRMLKKQIDKVDPAISKIYPEIKQL